MSVRDARLMMADKRALAKQSERMNPVEPLKNTARKGRTTLVNTGAEYTGSGATPSTGLSQFRGGRKQKKSRSPSPAEDGLSGGKYMDKYRIVEAPARHGTIHSRVYVIVDDKGKHHSTHYTLEEAQKEMNEIEDRELGRTTKAYGEEAAKQGLTGKGMVGAGLLGQTRQVGAGTKKGQMRLTARKAYEPEAHKMGAALATHLKQLHGSGFYEDFRKGMELGDADIAGVGEGMSGGLKTGRYEGKGKLVIQHLPHGEGEEIVMGKGESRVRDEETKGCGKKTRKPAGPSDKRRARGAMVSKLMKEQGMTLAEASRHIKQHGLA